MNYMPMNHAVCHLIFLLLFSLAIYCSPYVHSVNSEDATNECRVNCELTRKVAVSLVSTMSCD